MRMQMGRMKMPIMTMESSTPQMINFLAYCSAESFDDRCHPAHGVGLTQCDHTSFNGKTTAARVDTLKCGTPCSLPLCHAA
jgi:hypothetical protein